MGKILHHLSPYLAQVVGALALVTYEPVEFEKLPIQIQDVTKRADRFRGRIVNLIKKNCKNVNML